MTKLTTYLVELALGLARRGRVIALLMIALLFGLTGLLGVIWPDNPLGEAVGQIKAGLETIATEPQEPGGVIHVVQ